MPGTLDDRTTAYILETRRPFEDLRQVASQLAGLLVLAASGARSAGLDQAALKAAREMFDRAADQIKRSRPSARSLSHHRRLLMAVAALDDALGAAATHRCGDRMAGVDAVLPLLKAGYRQLQQAADQLPGFDLVAFKQGCCAVGQAS